MPALTGTVHRDVNQFIDWLFGKEEDSDTNVATTAKHFGCFVTLRPAVRHPARWVDFEAMRTNLRWHGPVCSVDQFDAALAAYIAS